MIDEELRESITNRFGEDIKLFCNPGYNKSIVGFTEDGRPVYDYESMVKELIEDGELEGVPGIETEADLEICARE